VSILLGLALAVAQPQTVTPQPITLGVSHSITSRPLGEQRTINVVLPPSYAREPKRVYPVLYLIDGGVDQDLLHVAGTAHLGSVWGRSQEAIVVGIETKDRRRELVGPTKDPELLKQYPTAGGSAAVRAFIRNEVMPLVERTYRTNNHDAVIGESLAGLFIVETWLREPRLFDSYAAIDPSLWWDKEALSRTAAVGNAQVMPPLYVAAAKEQLEAPAALNRFVAGAASKSKRWCLNRRADLLHSTIYHTLTPEALQFLLPPAEAPPAEFGFEVQCSPRS
jgi:predicted alpha/beta superfamily hydrolase